MSSIMTPDEIDKGWKNARMLLKILREKAKVVIKENEKKLINGEVDEEVVLTGAFLIELTSSDGYVLIWNKKYYTSTAPDDEDSSLELTLLNPQREKMYQMSWIHIEYPKFPNGFSVLDEYIGIASKLQFTDVRIVGSNVDLVSIQKFCEENLGIEKEKYQPKILNCSINSPREGSMAVQVGEYLMQYHYSALGNYPSYGINCHGNGDTIDQTWLLDMGWHDYRQALVINIDEHSFLLFNTSNYSYEIVFVDTLTGEKKSISVSLGVGKYTSDCADRIKEILISNNDKTILQISYSGYVPKEEIEFDFNVPNSEREDIIRLYNTTIGNDTFELSENDAAAVLFHDEIKEFIMSAMKIVKEKYPKLVERMYEHSEFSFLLMYTIRCYERGLKPNERACETVDKMLKHADASFGNIKLKSKKLED